MAMTDRWPDPSKWISDLQHQLKGLDTVFLTYEESRRSASRLRKMTSTGWASSSLSSQKSPTSMPARCPG
ncbi:hypothetical protein AB5I41_28735 [Sphingomonas sp. MMS24-JH45]